MAAPAANGSTVHDDEETLALIEEGKELVCDICRCAACSGNTWSFCMYDPCVSRRERERERERKEGGWGDVHERN